MGGGERLCPHPGEQGLRGHREGAQEPGEGTQERGDQMPPGSSSSAKTSWAGRVKPEWENR